MKLHHKILGQGTPIIILHGLFGMLDNWMSIGKNLAKDYKVILVDHRNHGKSPHADDLSYELYAQDVKELLDDLNISKTYILGHSMGGKTAQYFSTLFPEKTLGMISVDMGSHGYYKGNHDEIFDAVFSIDITTYERRGDVDDALGKKIPHLAVRQFLLKNLARSEKGYVWKVNFKVLHDKYDQIRQPVPKDYNFEGKALFIRGSHSSYIRDEDFEYSKNIFQKAKLETIDDAGHWVHAEKPKELIALVTQFLE